MKPTRLTKLTISIDDSDDSQLLPPLGLSLAITILLYELTCKFVFSSTFTFPFSKALVVNLLRIKTYKSFEYDWLTGYFVPDCFSLYMFQKINYFCNSFLSSSLFSSLG